MNIKALKLKFKVRYFLTFLLVIAIVVIVFGAGNYSFQNINNSQYRERVENSNILMEKICNHVETAVDFNWERIGYVAKHIEMEHFTTIEELFEYIKVSETSIKGDSFAKLLLIDDNGMTYVPGEDTFKWMDVSILNGEDDVMYISDYQFASKTKMQMYYVVRFEKPVIVDEVVFTHVSLACDMSELDSFFDVSNYSGQGYTFIIHKNGAQIYRQEKEDPLLGIYNLLSALKNAEYNYDDTYEQVLSDIEMEKNDTVHLTYKDQNYFASYYKLDIKDWVVVLMVPEEYVGIGTQTFAHEIVQSIIVIMISLFVMLFLIFIIFIKQIMRKQKEVNDHLIKAAAAEHLASKAKTKFLSSMSHDIRTPLNAIIGMVEIALKYADNPEQVRDYLGKVKMASGHLLTLINDILDISKVESGKMRLIQEVFSLSECFSNLINITQQQVREKKLKLYSNTHNIQYEYLYGDKLRLNQVFINLLSNAVKYTGENGSIWVDIYEMPMEDKEGSVQIKYVVKDTGVGMTKEFQRAMYNSFSRVDDSRTNKIQGSGLGLAICKQMVELMGGKIECESEINVGTTFCVTLELQVAEKDASTFSSMEKKQIKQEFSKLNNVRILIAEDNDFNWEVIYTLLNMNGIVAERAENGLLCTKMLENAEPDYYSLVLMDVRMPVMGGCEATRVIRASGKAWVNSIPIVAMTADAFAEDVQECLEAGMNEHLSKPVDLERLLQIIQKITKL